MGFTDECESIKFQVSSTIKFKERTEITPNVMK